MMTREEYQAKVSKFTEEDFKNPTHEMEKDFWWKSAYADWELANGKLETYNNITELLDSIYDGDEL